MYVEARGHGGAYGTPGRLVMILADLIAIAYRRGQGADQDLASRLAEP
jgi:hypothetical protein